MYKLNYTNWNVSYIAIYCTPFVITAQNRNNTWARCSVQVAFVNKMTQIKITVRYYPGSQHISTGILLPPLEICLSAIRRDSAQTPNPSLRHIKPPPPQDQPLWGPGVLPRASRYHLVLDSYRFTPRFYIFFFVCTK